MSNIQFLHFQNSPICTTKINNELWWSVSDVCKVLGLSILSTNLPDIDPSNIRVIFFKDKSNKHQKVSITNNEGLFDIIENSAVNNADKFKDWVLSELASKNQSLDSHIQDHICDHEWLENRIQNIFSATNFIMSAFSSYVESKEGLDADIVYYPQNLSSGISLLNELIQDEYHKIIQDIKSLR